jgi:broad specificity phosphatase PhoE
MKTKKVILIRHGEYISIEPYNLSDEGRKSIGQLAIKLIPEIKDKNVVFLSSMANRATQSAEILQTIWKENGIALDLEKRYEVWSGTDARQEAARLLEEEQKEISVFNHRWLDEFIKASDKEVVIVVTHLEFVEDFPPIFGFSDREVQKGRARILDLEAKKETVM